MNTLKPLPFLCMGFFLLFSLIFFGGIANAVTKEDYYLLAKNVTDYFLSVQFPNGTLWDKIDLNETPDWKYGTMTYAYDASKIYNITGNTTYAESAMNATNYWINSAVGKWHFPFNRVVEIQAYDLLKGYVGSANNTMIQNDVFSASTSTYEPTENNNWQGYGLLARLLVWKVFGEQTNYTQFQNEIGRQLGYQLPDGILFDLPRNITYAENPSQLVATPISYEMQMIAELTEMHNIHNDSATKATIKTTATKALDATALLIAPDGDMNYFGRSNEFVAFYAQGIYSYEYWATQLKTENPTKASVYKAVAHRLFNWITGTNMSQYDYRNFTDGSICVTPVNCSTRAGWETDKHLTEYGPLAAKYLLLANDSADDSITESSIPSDHNSTYQLRDAGFTMARSGNTYVMSAQGQGLVTGKSDFRYYAGIYVIKQFNGVKWIDEIVNPGISSTGVYFREGATYRNNTNSFWSTEQYAKSYFVNNDSSDTLILEGINYEKDPPNFAIPRNRTRGIIISDGRILVLTYVNYQYSAVYNWAPIWLRTDMSHTGLVSNVGALGHYAYTNDSTNSTGITLMPLTWEGNLTMIRNNPTLEYGTKGASGGIYANSIVWTNSPDGNYTIQVYAPWATTTITSTTLVPITTYTPKVVSAYENYSLYSLNGWNTTENVNFNVFSPATSNSYPILTSTNGTRGAYPYFSYSGENITYNITIPVKTLISMKLLSGTIPHLNFSDFEVINATYDTTLSLLFFKLSGSAAGNLMFGDVNQKSIFSNPGGLVTANLANGVNISLTSQPNKELYVFNFSRIYVAGNSQSQLQDTLGRTVANLPIMISSASQSSVHINSTNSYSNVHIVVNDSTKSASAISNTWYYRPANGKWIKVPLSNVSYANGLIFDLYVDVDAATNSNELSNGIGTVDYSYFDSQVSTIAGNANGAIANLGSWLPTIGTVIAAVVIITLILGALIFRKPPE